LTADKLRPSLPEREKKGKKEATVGIQGAIKTTEKKTEAITLM